MISLFFVHTFLQLKMQLNLAEVYKVGEVAEYFNKALPPSLWLTHLGRMFCQVISTGHVPSNSLPDLFSLAEELFH